MCWVVGTRLQGGLNVGQMTPLVGRSSEYIVENVPAEFVVGRFERDSQE